MSETEEHEAAPDAAGRGKNEWLYVLAGSYEQARQYAEEQNAHPAMLVYVSDRYKMAGIEGAVLHVLGTASRRDDYAEVMQRAAVMGWQVKHV